MSTIPASTDSKYSRGGYNEFNPVSYAISLSHKVPSGGCPAALTGAIDSASIMMPRLAYTLDVFEMPKTYYSINRTIPNWTRDWEHDLWNSSYMIRATILAPE